MKRSLFRMPRLPRPSLLPRRMFVVAIAFTVAVALVPAVAGSAQSEASASGNVPVKPRLSHPVQDNQFYFVMPDRFRDGDASNNFGGLEGGGTDEDVLRHGYDPENKAYYHGGDLAGLLDKLDYLKGMGANAIWLTPSFQNKPVQGDGTIGGSSAGYHGYWITDFTRIDPHMGTNEELRQLIEKAHDRDMKVFFDIITNHTADVIYYDEGTSRYISKPEQPYRDADGQPFDDEDFAGTNEFPELDANESFPYTPVVSENEEDIKVPSWLNDPIYYHNRGDTDFQNEDEDQRYGDFVGLDDLFTEHPRVVRGMVDVYETWATDYGVDGFRIDTVKHVNMEFWQKFGPQVLEAAKESGNEDFFMYGEVFSSDKEFTSRYTTEGKLQAILDFPFQASAQGFASRSEPTNNLRTFFAEDDYFTDRDSNAYSLPTFLGNHDMGRFGFFVKNDNPEASEDEVFDRDVLGHELMYFSRGMPVVYYGDEQGFTGTGGDQLARQDMFPTETPEYADEDQIGTAATPSDDNFDTEHPLYEKFAELAALRQEYPALRYGAQIHRISSDKAGIYAFSRIKRDAKREFIVAVNNAESSRSATFGTFSPNTRFVPIYGGGKAITSDGSGRLKVNVPALGATVYRAEKVIPASKKAPGIKLVKPDISEAVNGRVEISAELDSRKFSEVTFSVRKGNGNYIFIGTDDNAPYRVFYDTKDVEPGTKLRFRAAVSDLNGHTRTSAPVELRIGR